MFLIFFALWLIFNAKFTLEICIFGIVLSALMYLFIWKVFGYKPKYDWLMVKLSLRGIKYFVILFWEIIKANIAVLKLIFTPKVEVKPKLVYFKVDLETNLAKFFLANSITLTPGTITADINDDEYCVHALDEDFSGGMDESTFVQQLKKMEEKR